MISFLTKKIFDFVSDNIELDAVKCQIYKYGIELCISTVLNILLIITAGAVLGCIWESLIFLIVFIILRQYTGGYHADTYFKCNSVFLVTFLLVVLLSKTVTITVNIAWIIIGAVVTTIIIGLFAPIDNHNKQISKRVRKKSKIIAVILWMIFSFIAYCLCLHGWQLYGNIIFYTNLSIILLMIIGCFKERRWKND